MYKYPRRVLASGWCVGTDQPESFYQMLNQAFEDACAGKKPCYLDNTEFVRVDPKYAGQTVFRIDSPGKGSKIVDRHGKTVPIIGIGSPISFTQWDPGMTQEDFHHMCVY